MDGSHACAELVTRTLLIVNSACRKRGTHVQHVGHGSQRCAAAVGRRMEREIATARADHRIVITRSKAAEVVVVGVVAEVEEERNIRAKTLSAFRAPFPLSTKTNLTYNEKRDRMAS